MGTRGRHGVAEIAVIGPSGIETVRRPEPPDELTDEQAIEWRAIVNRLAADWFPRETHPMLVQLCRQIVRARRLAQMIDAAEQADPFDEKAYLDLVRAEEAVSGSISSLSTRLRITQQATVRAESARKPKSRFRKS